MRRLAAAALVVALVGALRADDAPFTEIDGGRARVEKAVEQAAVIYVGEVAWVGSRPRCFPGGIDPGPQLVKYKVVERIRRGLEVGTETVVPYHDGDRGNWGKPDVPGVRDDWFKVGNRIVVFLYATEKRGELRPTPHGYEWGETVSVVPATDANVAAIRAMVK